jgi:hypothetical protein
MTEPIGPSTGSSTGPARGPMAGQPSGRHPRAQAREPFRLLPVGQVPGCPVARMTGAHEIDWSRSETGDLVSYGRSYAGDTAVTVTLARCIACPTPLLLVGACGEQTGYAEVWEIVGADLVADEPGGVSGGVSGR